jgi:acyl-CoA synthetase (NDP forming)
VTTTPLVNSLGPLFAPASVAVLGASNREGRPGYQVLAALKRMDPDKAIHPITPRYEEILGLQCFADMRSAPEVDLTIIASAPDRIEDDVRSAIEAGTRGLMIFGAPMADATRATWLTRIADMTREAQVPLLGPDTLGFVNFARRSAATWAFPVGERAGGVAVISQSGTVYWEANTNDPRLQFSFTGHSGLEATLSMADLVDYSLSLESTRVVGLYVETVRDPDRFEVVLAEALGRGVPVVAMYAGRTERSRAQMLTHAGRLAGSRSSLEGLFRRYGVARVSSSDEWWTTLALLGNERPIGPGGLAAIMDSGGGLAQFVDFADEFGVPLADIGEATKQELNGLLGHEGGEGVIDFWTGNSDRHSRTEELLTTLAKDPATAAVMAFTTYAETSSAGFATNVADACLAAARQTTKPILPTTYTSRQLHPALMMTLTTAGLPVLDGMRDALLAIRHAFNFRSFSDMVAGGSTSHTEVLDARTLGRWTQRMAETTTLMEAEALSLLAEFGVPCVTTVQAGDEAAAIAAALQVGYPVVLKTDEQITHKAALGGVRLHLADEESVRIAYREMSKTLGRRVVIAPMLSGVEVAVGIVGGQFGPTLMIAAGGTMIELLDDRCYLLAPVSPEEVALALADLKIGRLLEKRHGAQAAGLRAFCEAASRISVLANRLAGSMSELDVNPFFVDETGCVAVDALVATKLGVVDVEK